MPLQPPVPRGEMPKVSLKASLLQSRIVVLLRRRWEVSLVGVGIVIALIFTLLLTCQADPPPLPPLPTPTPAPAPLLQESVPAVMGVYREYRLYHFLYEWGACFGAEGALPVGIPEAAAYMTYELEEQVVRDIPSAVMLLLAAYDSGRCEERSDFAQHDGRGKWLRSW